MNAKARTATAADLLQRARDLVPALYDRVPEARERRTLPEATIADMQDAGFFRMLQPARWGGLEVHPNTFFDVQITLGTACPSTSWVLGVVGVHAWQLALFPEEAQEEVWGDDDSVLVSSSYAPVGKVTRVDGGFRLSGRWSFSSGSDHCQWVFLGAFVPTEPGTPPDMRTFLVPRRDYRIEDTWFTSGLQGTGSKDIVVEDVFVPEHRTHRFSDGFKQASPGHAVNDAPLFKLPFGQIFVRSVANSAIAIAQGALNAYLDVQGSRVATADKAKVADDPTTQVVAAEAESVIDETTLNVHRNFDEMMGYCERGEKIPLERRVKFRYDSARGVDKCVAAVDALFSASGGRAIFTTNPLNRYFQDIHAARAHYANNPDKPGRNYGTVQLGGRNTDFFI